MIPISLPKGYQRLGPFPLDSTFVFDTLASLETYATTNLTVYAGQICAVSSTSEVYIIKDDKSLVKIANNQVIVNHVADEKLHLTANQNTLLDGITVTKDTINYLTNVSSNIQDQLDGKSASGHIHANATVDTAGFMSTDDKTKLDAIDGLNTGDQTITLTGDVTGSGNGSFATTLKDTGVVAGQYNSSTTSITPFTVDSKGRITATDTAVVITPAWSSITATPDTLSEYGITDAVNTSETQTISGAKEFTTSPTVPLIPSAAGHAASKAYVDTLAEGLHVHASVHAMRTTSLAIIINYLYPGAIPINYTNGTDGVGAKLTTSASVEWSTVFADPDIVIGSRVILSGEETPAHNGIYVVSSSTELTRASDFDTPTEMAGGDFVFVTHGIDADTGWVLSEPVTQVGISPVIFTQFSGAGAYEAGAGLERNGTTFSVVPGNGITVDGSVSLSMIGSPGTYQSVTVDSYGRVASGTNPTTLSGYGITDAASSTSLSNHISNDDVHLNALQNTLLEGITVTSDKINYLSGVTSAIQNQLDGKSASGHIHAEATTLVAGFMSTGDKTKLDAIDGLNTGDQTITLTGDVTGSGTGNFTTTLKDTGTAGTYNNSATAVTPFTTDSAGRISDTGEAILIRPAWSSITATPDTLSEYGITDAATSADLSNHMGDDDRHLTEQQNILLDAITATSTEINQLSNVSSNIQDQLDGKSASSHIHANSTTLVAGFMSTDDKTKLDAIIPSKLINGANEVELRADANLYLAQGGGIVFGDDTIQTTAPTPDSYLLDRTHHTGTQSYTTITGLGSLATQSGTFSGTSSNVNTGDQTIILTGDVTGSGNGSFETTLKNTGTAGTYNDSATSVTPFTTDSAGRISSTGTAIPITPAWSSITDTPTTLGGYRITDAAAKNAVIDTSIVGGGKTFANADDAKIFHITGTNTLTLPEWAAVNAGWSIGIVNVGGAALTFNRSSTDTINNALTTFTNSVSYSAVYIYKSPTAGSFVAVGVLY